MCPANELEPSTEQSEQASKLTPDSVDRLLLRLEVETLFFEEAAMLDNWRLEDWLLLFTEDARYVVPTTDVPDGNPLHDVVFIDDDMERLRGRVNRLKGRHAHREYPWSRTRRIVTNVRLTRVEGSEIDAEASFIVYRYRGESSGSYVGLYRYKLLRDDKRRLRIRYRRAELDAERLIEHGAVSIIL
jgi:p-cumate 2,3-dioxygenase subunit beta